MLVAKRTPPIAMVGKVEERSDAGAPTADVTFWEPAAARTMHWYRADAHAWLTKEVTADQWAGWKADTAEIVRAQDLLRTFPWEAACDDASVPVIRWFRGGKTNAAFNELDRHVLMGRGNGLAFVGVASADGGDEVLSLGALLDDSAVVAQALSTKYGLLPEAQRIALYLPNDMRAVTYIEAAKRSAVPYVAVASGTSSRALASRLADTGAVVLVTIESLVPVAQQARQLVAAPPAGLLLPPCTTTTPPEGWQMAVSAPLLGGSRSAANSPPGPCIAALWQLAPPRPVDASFPLFILYTSGSTGKPKGMVHTHGGYQVGLCVSSEAVFAPQPASDVFFVIATPGWITGQSYMITAALLSRVPSVLLDGSPVSPPDRFAAVISRHGVSVLKAGSTFLRVVMTMPGSASVALARHDLSSLRLGTFCAEPVNEAVHAFAMAHLTPYYINSYWATEHGGIVWSRLHGSESQLLRPDTRSWPLPWIDGAVLVRSQEDRSGWRAAADGERGDVVIRQRYPYQALTVWQSDGFGTARWCGDVLRWGKYFEASAGYVQGDTAVRHADGAYTFHGRSDEVRALCLLLSNLLPDASGRTLCRGEPCALAHLVPWHAPYPSIAAHM